MLSACALCKCFNEVMDALYLTVSDIDECKMPTHGCEHNCINTEGSYECLCGAGFSVDADGRRCIQSRL